MSIDIIPAPVRIRPTGGQIPKRTVCNLWQGHIRRICHNVDRHYTCAGSRPTNGRADSEANRVQPLGESCPEDMI